MDDPVEREMAMSRLQIL